MTAATSGIRPSGTGRGFTLIEMLIVIGVIGLLVSIVAPAVVMARAMLDSFNCKNNLRSLAMGLINYSTDNKGCLPANVHDLESLRWVRIRIPAGETDPRVMGVLAPLVDNNQATFLCPTFKGDEGGGGDKALCHYAIPSIFSGLPIGLVQEAYFYHPLTSTDPAHRRLLSGAPMLVEPDAASLGAFDRSKRQWTTLSNGDSEPDGAFEESDKLATRRHIEKTCMAFQDGHAEDVFFPDEDITADQIFVVLSGLRPAATAGQPASSVTIRLGGKTYSLNDWARSENWVD